VDHGRTTGTNWYQERPIDLLDSTPLTERQTIVNPIDLGQERFPGDKWELLDQRTANPLPRINRSPVLQIPEESPWIFNVVEKNCDGTLMRVRWGPNYADPAQADYMEIRCGELSIWTNNPPMRELLYQRIRDPRKTVIDIDNYTLALKVYKIIDDQLKVLLYYPPLFSTGL